MGYSTDRLGLYHRAVPGEIRQEKTLCVGMTASDLTVAWHRDDRVAETSNLVDKQLFFRSFQRDLVAYSSVEDSASKSGRYMVVSTTPGKCGAARS
jgi:hypothetical protein